MALMKYKESKDHLYLVNLIDLLATCAEVYYLMFTYLLFILNQYNP